jgi:hypothetical protein
MGSCSIIAIAALIGSTTFLSTTSAAQGVANPPAASQTGIMQSESATDESVSTATSVPPLSVSRQENAGLLPGTSLLGELSRSLNVKKLKAGDVVKARLTQDLIVQGRIVAPTDSQLVGHVTEAKARTASGEESRLGIVFDRILLKQHKELDFHAVLQALAPPLTRLSRADMLDPVRLPSMGISLRPGSQRNAGGSRAPIGAGPRLGTSGRLGENDRVPRERNSGGRPTSTGSLSAGAGVQGVYGIKDLSLSSAGAREAVIVSKTSDVKLSSGTQVLVSTR